MQQGDGDAGARYCPFRIHTCRYRNGGFRPIADNRRAKSCPCAEAKHSLVENMQALQTRQILVNFRLTKLPTEVRTGSARNGGPGMKIFLSAAAMILSASAAYADPVSSGGTVTYTVPGTTSV